MTQKKERQSNIELIRILAIMGVIVMHYINPQIGGGLTYAKEGGLNYYILFSLESVFVCAVNLFMLISGYFMCESKKRNLWKPIELIVEVIVFREGVYLASVLLGRTMFSIKTMMAMLMPANYFVILYCVVFILSPFINIMIEHISDEAFLTLVICNMLLFSVYSTFVDVLGELKGAQIIGLSSVGAYGSQWGYTIVNFMMMYVLGAFLKKGYSKIKKWSTQKLIIAFITGVVIIVAWAQMNDKVGFLTERSAWEYCNPLVVAEAMIIFCIFLRINLGTNKVINILAKGVFTVFLLHPYFIPHLRIKRAVEGNALVMMLHMLGCVVAIYMICWLVDYIYHLVTDPVFKKLSRTIRLPMINAEV